MAPSRRDFIATAGAAALGALVRPWPAALAAQRAEAAPVSALQAAFTPVRRNVGVFTMRGGTVGWLVNPGGVAVVDTQFPAEARTLLAGLQERSGNRGVELLINTHHHSDHTSGNGIFRGVARRVVAHAMADQHMRRPPVAPQTAQQQAAPAPPQQPAAGQPAPPPPLFPDHTFTHAYSSELGDERIVARHHGRAHTSGDVVVTFERANVVHMGDLAFNRRHPVVDRAAGANMRHWARVLEEVVAGHASDTIYIFGHSGSGLPVTGAAADLLHFRDYLRAVLGFVERQVAAGRSRDEVMAMRDPLAGFEAWGPFGQPGPRDALTVAYEEVVSGA